MTLLLKTKYWHFDQNNSGGNFHINDTDGIGPHVVIEAANKADAIKRAFDLGIYFDGVADGRDCECCGDRWYEPWKDDGYDSPLEAEILLREDYAFMWHDTIYVHMLDGEIVRFKKNDPTLKLNKPE